MLLAFYSYAQQQTNFKLTHANHEVKETDTYFTVFLDVKSAEYNVELELQKVVETYKHRIKKIARSLEYQNAYNFILDDMKEIDLLQILNTSTLKAFTASDEKIKSVESQKSDFTIKKIENKQ